MRRAAILALVTAIVWSVSVSVADAQVRDAVRAKTGTGVISGTVVSAESPERGLRRVTVMLGAGDQIKLPTNVVTDDAGRFSFQGLPAGTYTLMASRAGYVIATYGAKVPGRAQGTPISLAEGQHVSDIVVPVLHGAAVSGTVRLPSGRPGVGLNVMLLTVKNVGGERRMNPVLVPARTDDRGVYRAYGLAPGDYVVRVEMAAAARQDLMRPMTKDELE